MFQQHPNSVSGIAGVVVMATEFGRQGRLFESSTGAQVTAVRCGFAIATARGAIDVLAPAADTARYGGETPALICRPRPAAQRLFVADATMFQGLPEEAGMAGLETGGLTLNGRQDALSAALVSEPRR